MYIYICNVQGQLISQTITASNILRLASKRGRCKSMAAFLHLFTFSPFGCYVLDLVGHISWLSASAGCQSCHCAEGLCECMDKAHAKLSPPKPCNAFRASYVLIAVRATSHPLETGKLYSQQATSSMTKSLDTTFHFAESWLLPLQQ